MVKEILRQTEDKMQKTVEAFRRELASVKAGRATPALLDRITVEYYGQQMPINQIAGVTAPEPRLLVIQPWDKGALRAIEKAIMASDLGINPTNDGNVIRLAIPQLTEERRKELVKTVHRMAEEQRVVIRNHRRDANDQVKKAEKDKSISEDEAKRGQDEVQKLTDKYIKEIDQILANKEKEMMEV